MATRKLQYTRKIRSSSNKKVRYTVKVYGPRTATCDCKGYRYHHKCWHRAAVLATYRAA
jgi:uncharacterized Zn finger protein